MPTFTESYARSKSELDALWKKYEALKPVEAVLDAGINAMDGIMVRNRPGRVAGVVKFILSGGEFWWPEGTSDSGITVTQDVDRRYWGRSMRSGMIDAVDPEQLPLQARLYGILSYGVITKLGLESPLPNGNYYVHGAISRIPKSEQEPPLISILGSGLARLTDSPLIPSAGLDRFNNLHCLLPVSEAGHQIVATIEQFVDRLAA